MSIDSSHYSKKKIIRISIQLITFRNFAIFKFVLEWALEQFQRPRWKIFISNMMDCILLEIVEVNKKFSWYLIRLVI